jgi:hypothetical protein
MIPSLRRCPSLLMPPPSATRSSGPARRPTSTLAMPRASTPSSLRTRTNGLRAAGAPASPASSRSRTPPDARWRCSPLDPRAGERHLAPRAHRLREVEPYADDFRAGERHLAPRAHGPRRRDPLAPPLGGLPLDRRPNVRLAVQRRSLHLPPWRAPPAKAPALARRLHPRIACVARRAAEHAQPSRVMREPPSRAVPIAPRAQQDVAAAESL